jgi:hypothetical protein
VQVIPLTQAGMADKLEDPKDHLQKSLWTVESIRSRGLIFRVSHIRPIAGNHRLSKILLAEFKW